MKQKAEKETQQIPDKGSHLRQLSVSWKIGRGVSEPASKRWGLSNMWVLSRHISCLHYGRQMGENNRRNAIKSRAKNKEENGNKGTETERAKCVSSRVTFIFCCQRQKGRLLPFETEQ